MLQLLTTDFDGTSIGLTPRESCVDALALALEKIKYDQIIWAICTGRDFLYLLEGLEHFGAPVQPDYLITSERYLYYYDQKKGWQEFLDWNRQCDLHHEELFKKGGSFFEKVKSLMERYQQEAAFLENHHGILDTIVTDDKKLLDEIVLEILSLSCRPDYFSFQRSGNHLRFCHEHYDKGRMVHELSCFLSLTPENVLAIGDHYNDLSMFDDEVANMVACPSNAHAEVKAAVQKRNGYISVHAAGEGTAEGIHFYHQKHQTQKPRKT